MLSALLTQSFCTNPKKNQQIKKSDPKVEKKEAVLSLGAERTDYYLPILKDKKIALVVNQTSMIGTTHLVDSLLNLGVEITQIFAPEHGFRGDADAGEHVKNGIDSKTNLPIISLYGKNKKPFPEQLKGIDMVVFDIQDVGARFYTYISTMHYVMEACAEEKIPFMVFDRPNPNGHYIAGPVLDPKFSSFVGMHPIPVVHGLTVGELAHMINEEGWLKNKVVCDLQVVKCENYSHKMPYSLPVKPSPNLPNDLSIQLYPSLCLFEGTNVSVGRGTYAPFQLIGVPFQNGGDFQFTPKSIEGMSKYPPYENKVCYGIDFREQKNIPTFSIQYVIDFYNKAEDKKAFFSSPKFFNKLIGTDTVLKQIKEGWSEEKIVESWQPALKDYLLLRKQYLIYED